MNIGEKIKSLRIKNDLTQEELADRCELTKGFISQVERDLTSPSISTFIDILEGLGTNLKDFFSENTDEKVVFTKENIFENENKDLKYKLKWIIPNAQKNMMEPVLIYLEAGGKTKEDFPHEGEEFGYVMDGSIYLHIGKNKYNVNKGESFYFKANLNHYISNAKRSKARIIWVSTPPSF
ncbi:MAG: helix-turn-helix domain-containing protein [Tissierella sp.]|uniref:helix-turn-helix domain-containing protein n=1 Tax=Tissierella sp. TaxID=41274 RepID=UPI003F9D43A4